MKMRYNRYLYVQPVKDLVSLGPFVGNSGVVVPREESFEVLHSLGYHVAI